MRVDVQGSPDRPLVALTFDDGPNPYCTGQILDILEAYHARGTFFTIGCWADLWPDMLRRVAERHVVGNHSYLHENPAVDFDVAEAVIQRVIGRGTDFVRVPFHADPSPALAAWIGTRRCVNGNVYTDDWESSRTAEGIYDRVVNNPALGNGAIVIFHDGSESIAQLRSHPLATIEALPRILAALTARGLQAVGLDQMFAIADQDAPR